MEYSDLNILDFLIKAGAAAVSGGLMGLERQIKGKHAGLKTYTLVALGATVFMMISLLFKDADNTDMTRIIGQIVVGVGFLGAGVIMQRKSEKKVEGLATAATIWCSAGAGCLAGLGQYLILVIFTVMVILVNLLFGYLNHLLSKSEKKPKDD